MTRSAPASKIAVPSTWRPAFPISSVSIAVSVPASTRTGQPTSRPAMDFAAGVSKLTPPPLQRTPPTLVGVRKLSVMVSVPSAVTWLACWVTNERSVISPGITGNVATAAGMVTLSVSVGTTPPAQFAAVAQFDVAAPPDQMTPAPVAVADTVTCTPGKPGTVTIICCVPMTAPSVHAALASPAALVTAISGDELPPPVETKKSTVVPAIGLLSASRRRTVMASVSSDDAAAVCALPATMMTEAGAPAVTERIVETAAVRPGAVKRRR